MPFHVDGDPDPGIGLVLNQALRSIPQLDSLYNTYFFSLHKNMAPNIDTDQVKKGRIRIK